MSKGTVFITGASAGIGEALACQYAKAGYDLVLCARRWERLTKVTEACRRMGPEAKVLTYVVDVRQASALNDAVRSALQELGRLDIVIANAGFAVVAPFEKLTVEDYQRQWETNVVGVLNTVYATLEELKKTQGRLVLMGSVNSIISTPLSSPYCMSKFAIRGLAGSLREEFKEFGVSVTLICPGYVQSEIHQVDNRGQFRSDWGNRQPKALAVPASRAARAIFRQVRKRKGEVVITAHGKILVWIYRWAPGLLYALMRLAFKGSRPRSKSSSMSPD